MNQFTAQYQRVVLERGDIVGRLRKLANAPIGGIRTSEDALVGRAADEIESLRSRLAEADALLRGVHGESLHWSTWRQWKARRDAYLSRSGEKK